MTTQAHLAAPPTGALTRWLRKRLFASLEGIEGGQLEIRDRDGSQVFGTGAGLRATLTVDHGDVYRMVAVGGTVGAAESYMSGHWQADDLTAVVRILVRNQDLMDGMETGLARITAPVLKWLHSRNRNTPDGSARNIAAHYDLGNEFFELFLDHNMMYSSAMFRRDDEALETASDRKLEQICRKLQLGPDDRVLEIGTGWGGFAIFAATRYGCHVTTTTISTEQHDCARQRIADAGLSDRITLLKSDYRDLQGQYDKLVSIEMIEAVGPQFLPVYVAKCSQLLRPHGMMLLQAITIEDHRYERAIRNVDFIQRYIFPGSFIPSVAAICGAMARHSDLRLFHLEDIGPSYALTLREWRRRFMNQLDRVRELGYSETFIRMWEFYLCYCEGGFIERSIGDVHMLLTKPQCRRPSLESAL